MSRRTMLILSVWVLMVALTAVFALVAANGQVLAQVTDGLEWVGACAATCTTSG